MDNVKIAFLDIVGLRYNGYTLEERGLGGSESATIYMAKELSELGFDVTVFCKVQGEEGDYSGVRYLSNEKCKDNVEDFDILVTLRSCVPYIPIQYREDVYKETGYDILNTEELVKKCKHKVLWLHDTFCSGDNWLEHICIDGYFDEIFTLSDWHSNYIMNGHIWRGRIFEVLKTKVWQTRNGIKNYIEEVDILQKDKDLFVYNASVSKGMTPLLDRCWEKIRKEIPTAKLMVIGGYYRGANNDNPDEQEIQWNKLKDTHDGKNGVHFTGIIPQKEIAEILSKASLMIYPSVFPETFGISTLESLNYNTPLVTCRFGALEETAIEKSCYLINYDINYNENQVNTFVNMVLKAYNDDYLRKQKMYACNEIKEISTWNTVALQWKQHFYKKLDLYMPLLELNKVRRINSDVQRLFKRRFVNEEDILENSLVHNKFFVITPVFNSEKYIKKCMDSVANQIYNKYKMIIIDDMSTDNTVNIIKDTISNYPPNIRNRFQLVVNTEKKYAVSNQVDAIKLYATDSDIIVLLDGDDWLANDNGIFNYLDNLYSNGVDMSYGSCHSLIDNIDLISEPYPKKVIEDKSFRTHLFTWGMPYTHLRTFKKELFNKIDKSLLRDENGDHWKAGGDNALFYPLLENSKNIKCVQRILMVYNDTNPINDYKVNGEEQIMTANKIRGVENSKKYDVTDMRELKDIYEDVLKRDSESINLLKETLINRKDAWIDNTDAPNIIDRKNWLKKKFTDMNISKDSSILDIGSWTGGFINQFYEMGYKNISCLEISKEAVKLGKETYPKFNWMNYDVENVELDKKYDVIIMFEVIEHLVNPIETLTKIKSKLNDGGMIFFSIPKEESMNADGMAYEHISYISKEQLNEFNADVEYLSSKATHFNWYMGSILKDEKKDIVKDEPSDKIQILLAIPTAKNVETSTFQSIYNLDIPKNVEINLQFFYGYNVDQVRNLISDFTIKNNFDYVFCVDSDIVLPKDALVKLLNQNKDIISGIYKQRFLNEDRPEIYLNKNGYIERATMEDIKENKILEVSSCGFGCTLISKNLLYRIGYPQFEYHSSIDFKDTISEDTDFCIKANKCGTNIYVDTSIRCGHIGSFELKI